MKKSENEKANELKEKIIRKMKKLQDKSTSIVAVDEIEKAIKILTRVDVSWYD